MKIKPQPGPQTKFLASIANLVFYGGAAGGGKSYGLLLDPLRYLTGEHAVPGFNGVIFRRTVPEITKAGALWDTSVELYGQISGAIPRVGYHDWTFPPYGNRISFHHLQHPPDVLQWQGSQVTYFGWDEITHFLQRMFEYVTFSRGRSQCEIESYSRATCNPDPGWVKKTFLAPWVDKEFKGRKAEAGEIRYFIRDPDTDDLKWVACGTEHAQSITFIPSRVTDNPIMLRRNPGYIGKLMAMPRVERERLLFANWDVRAEGLVYPEAFEPEHQVIVEHEQHPRAPDEGGMDFGLIAPFVAISGYVNHDDILWVTGERYIRGVTIPTHSQAIPKGVEWHADPAGAQEILQLVQAGHQVRSCVHIPTRGASGETKSPKRSGIDMVRHRMRTGRLKIVRSKCPNLVRELGLYIYDPEKPDLEEPLKEHDHTLDALRYWVVAHDRGQYVPDEPETGQSLFDPTRWK